ncbi:MAG: Gfo/Idh/MocA family oxidoreductase [Candidatus Dormibacteraeota bacterium]|nr:Gfo/Idh/MocA family oxidoreductase [Candidatus Dormibacteraeota bacterium]
MRVAMAGLGFFSQFHVDAWRRLAPAHHLVAAADPDQARWLPGVACFQSVEEMLAKVEPDLLDIVTRPDTHSEIARAAFSRGIAVISQKPLAPSLAESAALVEAAERAGVRLLVHDNWRFQPWWQAVDQGLRDGVCGRAFCANFRIRTGDGRGDHPFPAQPYFSAMPWFLFYETAIHHIDCARFLFGEVAEIHAVRSRVRDDIAGEDLGAAVLEMDSGVVVVIDGNRWTRAPSGNAALGTAVIEGTEAVLTVAEDGVVRRDGQEWFRPPPDAGYRGDSVFATITHLTAALASGEESSLEGRNYLRTMAAMFACYR